MTLVNFVAQLTLSSITVCKSDFMFTYLVNIVHEIGVKLKQNMTLSKNFMHGFILEENLLTTILNLGKHKNYCMTDFSHFRSHGKKVKATAGQRSL